MTKFWAVKDELEQLRSLYEAAGHVETSKEIAKIGAPLERLGSESYDYRLFM